MGRIEEERPDRAPTVAQHLFTNYLIREDAGDEAFEELVESHPENAEELRTLDGELQDISRILGIWGAEGSIAEQIVRAAGRRRPADAGDTGAEDHLGELLLGLKRHTASFDRYEIRGEIGRGGMGVVQEAWDGDLKRDLAIKLLGSRAELRAEET